MLRRPDHNAVFFIGEKSDIYAKVAWKLLRAHGAEDIAVIDNDSEVIGLTIRHVSKRLTFIIHDTYPDQLPLDQFGRKAIVQIGHPTLSMKGKAVHIIRVDDEENHGHRLHRIFRGLGSVRPAPIHPAVFSAVLQKNTGQPGLFAKAFKEQMAA